MNKIIEYILNWWASRPSNIFVNGETVAVLPQHWMQLSWVNVLALTLIPVIISIFICYTATSKRGGAFLLRWWIFNAFTSIFVAIIIFFFMYSKTFVGGTIENPIYWKIPLFMIVSRSLVGFFQSLICYIILSSILARILGGLFNKQKFLNNMVYPLPKLFNP